MSARTLLRGGCVLTLGAKTPNHPQADVLIEDGKIAEIGAGIRARDAEQIDASDTIVMPGFVDTHRHGWRSLFRNGGDDEADATPERLGADDVYAATLVGLLGAVEAGITTVVDRWDGGVDGAFEAALRAHVDAGLRTVLVDGAGGSAGAMAERLAAAASAGPVTTTAVGADATEPIAERWNVARERGMRIHVHAGPDATAGAVAGLGERGLLGEDVTLVHCHALDQRDLDAIAATGTALALPASSEMAGGFGSPPIQELMDRQIRPGLATGDERVTPGDLFAQMRATISLQHATVFDRKLAGKGALPRLMNTRDVIRCATSEGARVAGLAGVAGSLEPGMQADVIVLRTDRPNIFPINDPIGAVVWGMDTSNVDWVFVAGRALMRDGVLDADVGRARALAAAARERVRSSSGPVVGAASGASA